VKSHYFFDGWSLDVASGELRRGTERTRLQDHPLQLLVALLEEPGKLISREALIARLWPSGVVDFETGLNTTVRRLRVALHDEAEQPRYVETVPRRGYRFIGRLDTPAAPHLAPPRPAAETAGTADAAGAGPGPRRRWLIGAAAAALIILGLVLALRSPPPPAQPPERSIAVLPFADMSATHDEEFFADGMAEEILDLLTTIPSLKVIGRTSSFSFRGRSGDLRAIGRQLGARYIVEGSVRRVDARVRVGAQLVDSASRSRLWSGNFDLEYRDVLALQQQIASEIARALQVGVGADVVHAEAGLNSTQAYTYYLRGRWAIDRGDSGTREAKVDFEQSLALDPRFVKAAEGLALAYVEEIGGRFTPAQLAWPAAVTAAQRALQLDPNSALAHALLGLEKVTYSYDWQGAGAELERLLALGPRDPYALYIGAWLAFDLGRHADALRLQDAALALDPLNPDSIQNGAYIHYLLGDLDAAERGFRRSIEISSAFEGSHRMLGELLLEEHRPAEALAQMEAEPEYGRDLGLAIGYYAMGRRRESDAALARVEQNAGRYGEFNIALAHAFRGERDLAFRWLERAVTARDLNLGHRFKYDWMLAPLRGDPRYRALLREMRMPD
jgi:TolB-like protein/DNA-binding winged helix-turn-helix (wHTH) protein